LTCRQGREHELGAGLLVHRQHLRPARSRHAKAILAFLEEHERRPILERIEFRSFTENAVADVHGFLAVLADTRARGYAVDDEEINLGTRCIAAPVFDFSERVVAAIGITGPSSRISGTGLQQHAEQVMAAASVLSGYLSIGRPPVSGAGSAS
jgi:DNA-binding IclR family transcriptional regulator